MDLGALGSTPQTLNGFVGNYYGLAQNSYDYYKFQVTDNSALTLNLSGLSANSTLYLLNSNGGTITYSDGDAQATISKDLAPGTYYAQIYGATATPYTLQASVSSLPTPPPQGSIPTDNAGHTQSTALDLGTLDSTPQSASGFLGDYYGLAQNSDDYYKFQVTGNSTIDLSLSGLSANSTLCLLDISGSIVASTSGDTQALLSKNLAPGTYYAEVTRSSGLTLYTLQSSIKSLAPIPTDNAGHTQSTALDLGTLGSTPQSFSGFVGNYYGLALNNYDYYKLQIANNSTLNLNLSGLSSNLLVYLSDASGTLITSAHGDSQVSISQNLAPGTYYVEVEDSNSFSAATPYTLKASTTLLPAIPTDNAEHTQSTAQDLGTLTSAPQTLSGFFGNFYGLAQNSKSYGQKWCMSKGEKKAYPAG